MVDPAFDRQCRIARTALSVDTVFFSVVDTDRQFFPSHLGLPEPFASAGQTPLSHSFCQHVVSRAEPLIISDTANEPLVADNPARIELDIASYLGVPVRGEDGTVLGALCSTSPQVRVWSEDDLGVLTDIAQSIETELQLRSRSHHLETLLSDDRLAQEYADALSQLSAATNRLQTVQSISDELAERIGPAIGAALTSIAIVENDELCFTHADSVSPEIAQTWTTASIHAAIPMAAAITSGRIIHLEDPTSFADYPDFVGAAERLGLMSFRAIPFGDEALSLFGVLGIGWIEPTPSDAVPAVLGRIVDLARSALTRAWQFETEQTQARILERVVLPTSLPETSTYRVAGGYLAPEAVQRVGGDVYDVVVNPDGSVGVMIADAVGHDLTATRSAARLRHAIGVLLMEGYSPAAVMGAVNRYVSASTSKRLVTCACLLFAPDGASVTIANAGHPQPVLRSSAGARFVGPVGESLLGRGAVEYSETTVPLAEDDFVLCFTDGLIDRRGRSYIESEQWLLDFVANQTSHAPRRITERLREHLGEAPPDDDVAFIVVSRRAPEDPAEMRWARPAGEVRLGPIRSEIEDWAAPFGVRDTHDLVLVANELVTNARDASQADDDVIFVLELLATSSPSTCHVRMSVSNRTPPFDITRDMPDASSFRGRGLAMSRALAQELVIDTEQGWVVAAATLHLERSADQPFSI